MKPSFLAGLRALKSLGRRDIFWHLLWPGLLAMALWTVLAVLSWSWLLDTLHTWLAHGWASRWLMSSETIAAVVMVLLKIALATAFLPLIYLTAALLVSVLALPLMLERIARTDYPLLLMRHGGSNLGSAWNAFLAILAYLGMLLLTLPLWLIPGAGLVLSVLLTGWLNQRAFRYDALMAHASHEEMQALWTRHRSDLLLIGAGGALCAFIPFFNLVAPALCGLTFVHFLLDRLAAHRHEIGNEAELMPPAADSRAPTTGAADTSAVHPQVSASLPGSAKTPSSQASAGNIAPRNHSGK